MQITQVWCLPQSAPELQSASILTLIENPNGKFSITKLVLDKKKHKQKLKQKEFVQITRVWCLPRSAPALQSASISTLIKNGNGNFSTTKLMQINSNVVFRIISQF